MRKTIVALFSILLFGCGGGSGGGGGGNPSTPVVPKKYVLIVAGQSNASGLAVNSEMDSATASYTFTRTKYWVNGAWQKLKPFGNAFYDEPSNHGIEPYLAYLFEKSYPNDTLYIIKFSKGGTHLAAGDGLDWHPSSNELYGMLSSNYIAPALGSAELGTGYVPFAFWWMQGESDAFTVDTANAYLANLTTFFSRLAADMPATADFKRYIGHIRRVDSTWPYGEVVRAAQAQYCANAANNAILIQTDNVAVNKDGNHYSAKGFKDLSGKLFAAIMLELTR